MLLAEAMAEVETVLRHVSDNRGRSCYRPSPVMMARVQSHRNTLIRLYCTALTALMEATKVSEHIHWASLFQ